MPNFILSGIGRRGRRSDRPWSVPQHFFNHYGR